MSNLLSNIAEYLGGRGSLVFGANVFYYEMPEMPDECVCVYEEKTNTFAPPQVDAEVHRIRVGVRSKSNTRSAEIANLCYRWLFTDDESYETAPEVSSTTGFITLRNEESIFVDNLCRPVWDNVDQQGRKYFYFTATIITNRR